MTAEARVDHDAIAHNVRLLSGRAAASGAATMVVVKADGYGHGAVDVARTALAHGASWLGVCTLDEAAQLRDAGVTAPVLSWLNVPEVDSDAMADAVAAGVDLSVSSLAELAEVRAGARLAYRRARDRPREGARPNRWRARVHLKIDTGLSRNGCPPADWADLLDVVADEQIVDVVAVWSHLAHADAPEHPTLDRQLRRFEDAHRAAAARLGTVPMRHLANSAATLTRPDLHLDLVRPGIAVYGLDPVGAPDNHGLRPAMTFRSRVASVKRVAAGEGVSYGHEWTTPDERMLALVPVGYADGVPRRLGSRDRPGGPMTVQLAGARRPVVGRVCMDQVVVDLGPAATAPEVNPGDDVVLFGPGDDGEPTAAEWAELIDTIHYEIVTGVGDRPRVRRTVAVTA